MPRIRLLCALAAVACAFPAATASADVPAGADWTEKYIATPGQPTLHADVFRPKGFKDTQKTPVILAIGPYFGHGGQSTPDAPGGANRPSNRFDDMIDGGKVFQRGYTVVYVDLRGFGGSTGCNDFGGPGEQNDVKRAVEWAASQPWSTGKVGMWGKSYDAWTQVMALDEKPKGLAAAIIQAPIIDGYRTLYQNGVHYDSGWYGTPALYQAIDAIPPTPGDNADYYLAYAQGSNPACYAQNIGFQNSTLDWSAPFWQQRNLPNARGSDVPVLWSHGFMDANTKPDNFLSVWETLKGPKHAWFGQWDHVRGNESNLVGRKGFIDESMRWLDRYVKGDAGANPDQDPVVTVQEGDGKFRVEDAWPPADAKAFTMPLKAGSVTDAPNNDAEGETGGEYGVGVYSATKPFPNDAHLSGLPKVTLDVSAPPGVRSHVYALVYDLDQKNVGQLITRGAHMVQGSTKVNIELYPNDWTIKAGHRLLVLVTGADLDWWNPPHSGQSIDINGGSASFPFLQYKRTGYLQGGKAAAMSGRKLLQFDIADVTEGTVEAALPPALQPFPAGQAPKGGNQITEGEAQKLVGPPPTLASSRAARQGAKRMRVSVRRVRLRGRNGFTVIVTNATAKKLRLELRRGAKRVIGRRVVRVRRGTAKATFRQRGKGRFRVYVRSTAKSRRILARSTVFRGW